MMIARVHGISSATSAWLTVLRHGARCFCSPAAAGFAAPPPLPQQRVVVTGLGLVTPLGRGVEASWAALTAGRTGVRRLQPDDLPEEHRAHMAQLPSQARAGHPRARGPPRQPSPPLRQLPQQQLPRPNRRPTP